MSPMMPMGGPQMAPDEQMLPPGPPGQMPPGAPSTPGMAGPETLDGQMAPEAPTFVSTDPAQMAALAMQVIGELAAMDQQNMQLMIEQAMGQFAAQQQQAILSAPDIIAQMIAQLAGSAEPPQTLDGPASTLPMDEPAPDELEMVA